MSANIPYDFVCNLIVLAMIDGALYILSVHLLFSARQRADGTGWWQLDSFIIP